MYSCVYTCILRVTDQFLADHDTHFCHWLVKGERRLTATHPGQSCNFFCDFLSCSGASVCHWPGQELFTSWESLSGGDRKMFGTPRPSPDSCSGWKTISVWSLSLLFWLTILWRCFCPFLTENISSFGSANDYCQRYRYHQKCITIIQNRSFQSRFADVDFAKRTSPYGQSVLAVCVSYVLLVPSATLAWPFLLFELGSNFRASGSVLNILPLKRQVRSLFATKWGNSGKKGMSGLCVFLFAVHQLKC